MGFESNIHAFHFNHPTAKTLGSIFGEHIIQLFFKPFFKLFACNDSRSSLRINGQHIVNEPLSNRHFSSGISRARRAKTEAVRNHNIRLRFPHQSINEQSINGIFNDKITIQRNS